MPKPDEDDRSRLSRRLERWAVSNFRASIRCLRSSVALDDPWVGEVGRKLTTVANDLAELSVGVLSPDARQTVQDASGPENASDPAPAACALTVPPPPAWKGHSLLCLDAPAAILLKIREKGEIRTIGQFDAAFKTLAEQERFAKRIGMSEADLIGAVEAMERYIREDEHPNIVGVPWTPDEDAAFAPRSMTVEAADVAVDAVIMGVAARDVPPPRKPFDFSPPTSEPGPDAAKPARKSPTKSFDVFARDDGDALVFVGQMKAKNLDEARRLAPEAFAGTEVRGIDGTPAPIKVAELEVRPTPKTTAERDKAYADATKPTEVVLDIKVDPPAAPVPSGCLEDCGTTPAFVGPDAPEAGFVDPAAYLGKVVVAGDGMSVSVPEDDGLDDSGPEQMPWEDVFINALPLDREILAAVSSATQIETLGDLAAFLEEDGYRHLVGTDKAGLTFVDAAKVLAAMQLWWSDNRPGDFPFADNGDCIADREKSKLLVDWLNRKRKGYTLPTWGRWSEFEVGLEDGKQVKVVHDPSGAGHFDFHGPLTSTGYLSHHCSAGDDRAPIIEFARDLARKVAAESAAELAKEQKRKAREEKAAARKAKTEEAKPAPVLADPTGEAFVGGLETSMAITEQAIKVLPDADADTFPDVPAATVPDDPPDEEDEAPADLAPSEDDVDAELQRALAQTAASWDRWSVLRRSGATNDQVRKLVAREFGDGGYVYREPLTRKAPGHTVRGGNIPGFWLGARKSRDELPYLRGTALVARARAVMEIPEPKGQEVAE